MKFLGFLGKFGGFFIRFLGFLGEGIIFFCWEFCIVVCGFMFVASKETRRNTEICSPIKRKNIEKEIATLTTEQITLENKILEAINEHASQDKAVYHAIKLVEKISKDIDEFVSR